MNRDGRDTLAPTWFRVTVGACAVIAVALTACSDDTDPSAPDGPAAVDGAVGDRPRIDAKLWPCSNPGKTCNAHDPCAINPICGKDGLCHPDSFQDCSDGLDCTDDSCSGSGLCSYKVKGSYCTLSVPATSGSKMQCVKDGFVNPKEVCQICDTSKDQKKWSPRTGGTCDDATSCTKDDQCSEGTCKGTYYGSQCSDGLECTDDVCDGKGGCSNKMKTDRCKISGACYKSAETDTSGCAVCDPKTSQSAWTLKKDVCKIGAKCHAKGAADTTGCGVCDPAKSATGWTPATDKCLILGTCYAKGDPDPTGCGTCEPAKSSTAFTPVAGKCLIRGTCHKDLDPSPSGCGVCASVKNYSTWTPIGGSKQVASDFESGLGSWKVSTAVDGVGWQVSSSRAHGGKASLLYGDPVKGGYDNGKPNSGTATMPAVALPAGQKAALTFWLFLDTESTANYDVLSVSVGASTVWTKSTNTTMPLADYRQWVQVEIDLSAWAGSSVQPAFAFDTKDAWANTTEGVYLDDVTVITNCGKP